MNQDVQNRPNTAGQRTRLSWRESVLAQDPNMSPWRCTSSGIICVPMQQLEERLTAVTTAMCGQPQKDQRPPGSPLSGPLTTANSFWSCGHLVCIRGVLESFLVIAVIAVLTTGDFSNQKQDADYEGQNHHTASCPFYRNAELGSFTPSTFVAPNALKVTDQMEFWKEGAKKIISLNPILVFLIGVLVNFDWQNY